jgi:4-alpha-glucanotransferase
MAARPRLRALAERAGVVSAYRASDGRVFRTTDRTREALLGAMGLDASSERAARAALLALEEEDREAGPAREAECCTSPGELLGRDRAFGLWANLYTLRSREGLGIGNLGDLARLARFAGSAGADFLGLNPLYALRNRTPDVSPYSPVTRLFRNPLYLDVRAVPELADSARARELLERPARKRALAQLRSAERIDYAAVRDFALPVIEALHRTFAAHHRGGTTARARAYAAFRARGGAQLEAFGVFCALEEHLGRRWQRWPARLRDPSSPAVAAFAREHSGRVALHVWMQFELDRQLARAARAARAAGLRIGLYQDLPLGAAADGFDAWAFPELVATGASLGAPPDPFAAEGQDWGVPPLRPRLLARGHPYWEGVLRAAFAHSGAVRIDHAMGLARQFWIPAGRPAREGAYVRFPFDTLVDALARESRRQRALVIGEDLGTVPRGFQSRLARRGILSSRVLLFERDSRGAFHPARRYSSRALVTANTHDLPPLAGFWSGRDLEILHELGRLPDERSLRRARAERERARVALRARLARAGLAPRTGPLSPPELCRATYAFLCRTPSPLVGVSLDDLCGETEPVNVPGFSPDEYPSWTRRMHVAVEDLGRDEGVRAAMAGLASRVRRA